MDQVTCALLPLALLAALTRWQTLSQSAGTPSVALLPAALAIDAVGVQDALLGQALHACMPAATRPVLLCWQRELLQLLAGAVEEHQRDLPCIRRCHGKVDPRAGIAWTQGLGLACICRVISSQQQTSFNS